MNDLSAGFDFLLKQNHCGIVYGVLKRLSIRRENPQFEDLKQEGFIHLAKKYCSYEGNYEGEKICGYLYQAVYWHILDLLRKQQRQNNHVVCSGDKDSEIIDQLTDSSSYQDEVDGIELLNQLWLACTGNERKFLCCSYNDSMTVTQIARKYKVSRKTVYQWKKGVQREFDKLR